MIKKEWASSERFFKTEERFISGCQLGRKTNDFKGIISSVFHFYSRSEMLRLQFHSSDVERLSGGKQERTEEINMLKSIVFF